MISGHGGNVSALAKRLGCDVCDIIDMSSNLNPLGPPRGLEAFLQKNIGRIRTLPSADADEMVQAFARYYQVPKDRVLAGNGTTQFIYTLPLALNTQKLLISGPTYSDYRDGCAMHRVDVDYAMATKENGFQPDLDHISDMVADEALGIDTVVICNPNNPTGALIQKQDIVDLISRNPDVCFVIDESYLPFVVHGEHISLVNETGLPNLVVLSSMSKIFRMPGLRTGFICAEPVVIDKFKAFYEPWSVNALAQAAVVHIFENSAGISPFIEKTRKFISQEKQRFFDIMAYVNGLQLYDSNTYFVLGRLTGSLTGQNLCRSVGQGKILIRDCANFEGLSSKFIRFSLKTRDQNMNLARLVFQVLGSDESNIKPKRMVS